MKHCPMAHCLIVLALALAASASMASNRLHNPARPDHTLTQQQTPRTVRSLRVKVLSTMLSGNSNGGIGEWGFAAIVEADKNSPFILFVEITEAFHYAVRQIRSKNP
jgi:hypothetical protein